MMRVLSPPGEYPRSIRLEARSVDNPPARFLPAARAGFESWHRWSNDGREVRPRPRPARFLAVAGQSFGGGGREKPDPSQHPFSGRPALAGKVDPAAGADSDLQAR